MTTLHIRQDALQDGFYPIRLTLKRPGQAELEANAKIEFGLTEHERNDLRWYMEDYLPQADTIEEVQVEQIEDWMKRRGEELYAKVMAENMETQAVWFGVREQLADLRVEISTGIAEAASIPWELMRDPQSGSAIPLRVQSFVRVQSNPNIGFVPVPLANEGRIRLLYIVCRPNGIHDVELRAIANRLLHDLGEDLARFEISALRPPTFEQLQKELTQAKFEGRPYHIVHFDGHGTYEDLSNTTLADWLQGFSNLTLGSRNSGKHGYLLFEHPNSEDKMRPVPGDELGKLLHDNGVPVLVLNACQTAMHEAVAENNSANLNVHDEVRAIGSLAQAVVDQGIPAVLGMRYSVFVVTAAQYIGQLYANLANGRSFGQAASEGRKHLYLNPDRWVGLQPRPLQDWFVPVVYEAFPIQLLPPSAGAPEFQLDQRSELDPVNLNPALLRYVPDTGFVGRDETLLMLDRAFDNHSVVLLHSYAGQGKSTTAVEFARWYSQTRGLGPKPIVLFTSFETHTDLMDVLNQIGQTFAKVFQANGIEWYAINDNAIRRSIIIQLLRQIPVLWIWDNIEAIAGFPAGTESAWTEEEQNDLHDFLKQIKLDNATKAKILLTSRRDEQAWLSGIPYRIEMRRMKNSDAANLALKLGAEKYITRNEIADWQPLLDYCNGNPLTLRVIVGQTIKMGLRGREQIGNFVESIRNGEHAIEDADEQQGRDKSLGASLDYSFRNAFSDDELPIIALLHLFQATVDVNVLAWMGEVDEYALNELKGKPRAFIESILVRAGDIGLLEHMGAKLYNIHPALPWFLRRHFERHYDGQQGRSTSFAAIRSWAEAMGMLSHRHQYQSNEGDARFIQYLTLEEGNILQARRIARSHRWLDTVISLMQGIHVLYAYQGRLSEWSRLVAEITPDYCTPDGESIAGQEENYAMVMDYRIGLARSYHRDITRALDLQQKLVAWLRKRSTPALTLPIDTALDASQRNRIRSLGVGLSNLGTIFIEQGNQECFDVFEETLQLFSRIQDNTAVAIAHYNLGQTYLRISAIRDLDAAEAAYMRCLAMRDIDDAIGRSQCYHEIGMVHHERFRVSRNQHEAEETILSHFHPAEENYRKALEFCPPDALTQLAPTHGQLAILYQDVSLFEHAREHYEITIRLHVLVGNHYDAGRNRHNIALLYVNSAEIEADKSIQWEYLMRAKAYAEAALVDFQKYHGNVSEDETKEQEFLDRLARDIAGLRE